MRSMTSDRNSSRGWMSSPVVNIDTVSAVLSSPAMGDVVESSTEAPRFPVAPRVRHLIVMSAVPLATVTSASCE